ERWHSAPSVGRTAGGTYPLLNGEETVDMLKDTMLYLAKQDGIRQFVSHNPVGRRVARRFVAGEALDEAMDVAEELNGRHISISLDHLGENVSDSTEARAAAADYIKILDNIAASAADANISVKLTALGLDISPAQARTNLMRVLERARELNIFVRVDMECADYTQATLEIVAELHHDYDNVGTVVQSMLYRTPKDVEALIASKTRVRLVKGAYLEPPAIAYPRKADVDTAYRELMFALLERGTYPAIATHDERLIADARRFAAAHGIAKARFEFQMLYGIRRDLQEKLAQEGYNVRVYVPYGTQWYPYLTRRMAERPANLVFVASNALRR
ncbi:MAG TPA: proline dehydrogenase family protein, partial [Ktedonobacterales bacterium]|nr:proline dehydrogenase family protein [Ktedonobacterales bacterium]